MRYKFLWLKNLYFAFSTLTIVLVNWPILNIVCSILSSFFSLLSSLLFVVYSLFVFILFGFKNNNNCHCHFSIEIANSNASCTVVTCNENRLRYRQVKQMKMRLKLKYYKNSLPHHPFTQFFSHSYLFFCWLMFLTQVFLFPLLLFDGIFGGIYVVIHILPISPSGVFLKYFFP